MASGRGKEFLKPTGAQKNGTESFGAVEEVFTAYRLKRPAKKAGRW
jgi:hypothetical protein